MTPLTAAATSPTVAERDAHIARVRTAVRAWQPYLESRATSPPTMPYVAPEGAGRLDLLCTLLGLDPFEADVVLTLWVLAFMPGWRTVVAALDTGHENVTALAISRLHAHPPQPRLSSTSALLAWHLVTEHGTSSCANPGLSLDPQILGWLEGRHEPDRRLIPYARVLSADGVLDSWPTGRSAAAIRTASGAGERLRVQLVGRDAGAAASCAAAIGAELGLSVLAVTPSWPDAEAREMYVRVQRQAYLDRCAVMWMRGLDVEAWPPGITWFPLQFTYGEAAASGTWPGFSEIMVPIPPPTAGERRQLWLRALPASASWPAAALDRLSQRYLAQSSEIADVAAMRPESPEEAARLLLAQSRGDLGTLAQRLETPFVWDDLVVPPRVEDALRDIAFEANDRIGFWEQARVARLFPQGRGLVTLFSGPPGTGKTMAAQVIAAELGLDLYRVDLSAVVSKWVGETSQNIQKILTRAADRNLALFFDEAESVYGRRPEEIRDAQDRFSGMDLSHLMIAIESYSGIVLLASNLKANIDPSFIRRIRYCVEFPKPDREARREIWRRMTTALWGAGTAASLRTALDAMSEYDTTGAQIKNTCLSAAFAARRSGKGINRRVLSQCLARELAKDGQGLSERALDELAQTRSKRGRR